MNKRTLLAALLVVPMSITFAGQSSIEASKESAIQNLEAAKSAAAEMRSAATTARADLQDKYIAMAAMAEGIAVSLKTAIAQTQNAAAVQVAESKSKEASESLKAIVVAIRAKNIPEAAAKANNVGDAIAQVAKAVHKAEGAATAVKEAAADIRAVAR